MKVNELSIKALEQLEARLLADLELVRQTKALCGRYQPLQAMVTPGAAAAGVPAAAPPPPQKSFEEELGECLAAFGGQTLTQEDFRTAMHKATKRYPGVPAIKSFFLRMLRHGKMEVAQKRNGRGGSLYRCTLPPPAPAASATAETGSPAAESVSPAH